MCCCCRKFEEEIGLEEGERGALPQSENEEEEESVGIYARTGKQKANRLIQKVRDVRYGFQPRSNFNAKPFTVDLFSGKKPNRMLQTFFFPVFAKTFETPRDKRGAQKICAKTGSDQFFLSQNMQKIYEREKRNPFSECGLFVRRRRRRVIHQKNFCSAHRSTFAKQKEEEEVATM